MGALWVATRGHGLLRLSRVGTRFQKSAQFHIAPDAVVAVDPVATMRGKVYFTSSHGLSVLPLTPLGEVKTTPFPSGASAGPRSVSVTPSGRVFAGSNAGVFMLQAGILVPIESRNDRARAPAVTLLSDREGQLWVGTIEAGLNVMLLGRGVRFLRAEKESFRSIDIDQTVSTGCRTNAGS